MAMAGTRIKSQCANSAGKATLIPPSAHVSKSNLRHKSHSSQQAAEKTPTNSHHNQKPRAKPPKIHHSATRTLQEIVRVGAASTYPIWQGRDHVGGYDEEGQVIPEKGGREDDEEEANCKDLAF